MKRRHPLEVTIDRLGNHVEDYYDEMDSGLRDEISHVIDAFDRIVQRTKPTEQESEQ